MTDPTVCPTCKGDGEVWKRDGREQWMEPCPDCNKAPQILGVDHSADGGCVVEGVRHTDGTIEVTRVTNTPTEGEKDIVKVLRTMRPSIIPDLWTSILNEAADEIEKLRKEKKENLLLIDLLYRLP